MNVNEFVPTERPELHCLFASGLEGWIVLPLAPPGFAPTTGSD
jgi:hypothetical protein